MTTNETTKVFGRADYQVAPVTGSGSKWVSSDRVTIDAIKQ